MFFYTKKDGQDLMTKTKPSNYQIQVLVRVFDCSPITELDQCRCKASNLKTQSTVTVAAFVCLSCAYVRLFLNHNLHLSCSVVVIFRLFHFLTIFSTTHTYEIMLVQVDRHLAQLQVKDTEQKTKPDASNRVRERLGYRSHFRCFCISTSAVVHLPIKLRSHFT